MPAHNDCHCTDSSHITAPSEVYYYNDDDDDDDDYYYYYYYKFAGSECYEWIQ